MATVRVMPSSTCGVSRMKQQAGLRHHSLWPAEQESALLYFGETRFMKLRAGRTIRDTRFDRGAKAAVFGGIPMFYPLSLIRNSRTRNSSKSRCRRTFALYGGAPDSTNADEHLSGYGQGQARRRGLAGTRKASASNLLPTESSTEFHHVLPTMPEAH